MLVTPIAPRNGLLPETEVFFCVDRKSQEGLFRNALKEGGCSNEEVLRRGEGYLIKAECRFLGAPASAEMRMDFPDEKHASGTSAMRVSGINIHNRHEAKYLGACKPNQKPGSYEIIESQPSIDFSQLSQFFGYPE